MQNASSKELLYAGFWVRLAAWIIDSLILLPVIFVVFIPFNIASFISGSSFLTTAVLFRFTIKDIFKYLIMLAYYVILTYHNGQTVGKCAMKIKVVTLNGEKTDFQTILYRESIGKFLSKIIIFIGYIMIGLDEEKKGLHDILSDTRVVYCIQSPMSKQQTYEEVKKYEIIGVTEEPEIQTGEYNYEENRF